MGIVWFLFGLTNGMSMGAGAQPQPPVSLQDWLISAAILFFGCGGITYLFVRHELKRDEEMKNYIEQKYPKPPTPTNRK